MVDSSKIAMLLYVPLFCSLVGFRPPCLSENTKQAESMSLAQGGGSASGAPGSSQSQLGSVTVSKLKRALDAAERAKEQ